MKDYSYELLDLLEKYKGDAEAALRGETSPWVSLRIFAVKGKPFRVAGNRKKDRVLQSDPTSVPVPAVCGARR